MASFFLAATLVVASVLCGAQALNPRPCPGGLTFISDLTVSSNDEPCLRFPCPMKKGKETEITVKVTTDKDVTTGVPDVKGIINYVPVPWAVPAAPGYPIVEKNGNEYTYKMRFPISSVYPSIRCTVTWKLETPDGENIFCFRMPVVVQSVERK